MKKTTLCYAGCILFVLGFYCLQNSLSFLILSQQITGDEVFGGECYSFTARQCTGSTTASCGSTTCTSTNGGQTWSCNSSTVTQKIGGTYAENPTSIEDGGWSSYTSYILFCQKIITCGACQKNTSTGIFYCTTQGSPVVSDPKTDHTAGPGC